MILENLLVKKKIFSLECFPLDILKIISSYNSYHPLFALIDNLLSNFRQIEDEYVEEVIDGVAIVFEHRYAGKTIDPVLLKGCDIENQR